jgi:uncharacterized protein (TIGR02145 family)
VNTWGVYWANTPVSANNGFVFSIRAGSGNNATLFNQDHSNKNKGATVRCVRDIEVSCDGTSASRIANFAVSWDNSRERTPKGTRLTWGSYVTATQCRNATAAFDAGQTEIAGVFKADCRQSASGDGSLFSFCAVMALKDKLCPPPWRLPTPQDFITTDRAFGGTGQNGQNNTNLVSAYIDRCGNGSCWAGSYTGYAFNDGTGKYIHDETGIGHYWAVDANNNTTQLVFGRGNVSPTAVVIPSAGYAVRCVRDI